MGTHARPGTPTSSAAAHRVWLQAMSRRSTGSRQMASKCVKLSLLHPGLAEGHG
jgi:hypothetical protein